MDTKQAKTWFNQQGNFESNPNVFQLWIYGLIFHINVLRGLTELTGFPFAPGKPGWPTRPYWTKEGNEHIIIWCYLSKLNIHENICAIKPFTLRNDQKEISLLNISPNLSKLIRPYIPNGLLYNIFDKSIYA